MRLVIRAPQTQAAPTAPAAVTDLSASSEEVGTVMLTWTDVVSASYYRIEQDGVLLEGQILPGAQEKGIQGLTEGQTYSFRVLAYNDVGSTPSNAATIILTYPAAATTLTATAV